MELNCTFSCLTENSEVGGCGYFTGGVLSDALVNALVFGERLGDPQSAQVAFLLHLEVFGRFDHLQAGREFAG